MRPLVRSALIGLLVTLTLGEAARSATLDYRPVSDDADGMLLGGSTWEPRTAPDAALDDLLLQIGTIAGEVRDVFLAYECAELDDDADVAVARVRFGAQGGSVGAPLDVRVTGALTLDPLATAGAGRFALPRTAASVTWTIDTAWASSGQRVAKWAESPNLAPILREVVSQPGWEMGPHVIALFFEVPKPAASSYLSFDDTHPRWDAGGNAGISPATLIVAETEHDAFWGKELLCRPTPTSVEVNVIPHRVTEAYVEYGPDASSLPFATPTVSGDASSGIQLRLTGLTPDTRTTYRLRYRFSSAAPFAAAPTHSFVSLPEPGAASRFVVTTDIHVTNQLVHGMDTMLDLLSTTLDSLPTMHPLGYHAWLDLGDLVVMRAQRPAFDFDETEQRYRAAREYVDRAGHSLPLLFVRGNHEEVNGWDLDGTDDNTAAWSGRALLKWFPPPLPDDFYAGNEMAAPNVGVPGNYFAFTIGDVRIRCLDPFLFSTTRPHNGHGETGGSLDPWDWRLGDAQYAWLERDLIEEHTPYRIVALHHLTSSFDAPGYRYGRGGTEVAKWSVAQRPSFEWGGEDATGENVLSSKRPGYDAGAIHDLLTSQANQVVLKGHDHLYARQELDGMVYLTLPKPDDTGQLTGDLWGWRDAINYPDSVSLVLENSGFLSVEADSNAATFEYVRTFPPALFGIVSDSFTLLPLDVPSGPGPAQPLVTSITAIVPNPARLSPRIEFELARSSLVTLSIRDVTGRLVRTLARGERREGPQEITWDRTDDRGRRVATGVYFVELVTNHGVDARKLMLLR